MPKHPSSRRGKVTPTTGIFPELQGKSRARRETQHSLTVSRAVALPPRNDLRPSLRIENVPIESVKPASRRVRRTEATQASRLDASLRRFGLCAPILVDETHRIVHGHGVWEAARRAGLTEIPIVEIAHLDQAEQRALAIALNRLGETGHWDEGALKLVHSADVILNILARRREPVRTITIMTPDALRLHHEPAADCARYDNLRRAG